MEASYKTETRNDAGSLECDAVQTKAELYRQSMQNLHEKKMRGSAAEFRNARVTSCSGVLLQNGKAVCVAFPTRKKTVDINAQKSSETKSLAL